MTDVLRPDLQLQMIDIDRITPYAQNAKKHPKDQIEAIAKSMKNFGFALSKAIEVDRNLEIINGHGRMLAARLIGLKEVPILVRTDLSEDQIRAYRLVDNKVAESEYDTDMQSLELKYLHGGGSMDMSEWFNDRDLGFAIEDLGEIDLAGLTEDLGLEVEQRASQTQEAIDVQDGKTFSLAKVIGYNAVNGDQKRLIALLQAHAETSTGSKGADALASFSQDFLGL